MIERQIVIGLIVSTDFLQQVRPIWENRLLKVDSAQRLAQWCIEYFDQYHKAPGLDIEQIYFEKLREGYVEKDLAEAIEDDLRDLSEEYEETFNLQYTLDSADKYLKERHLALHLEKVQELIDTGEPEQAQTLASSYKGIQASISNEIDLSDTKVLTKVDIAFSDTQKPVVVYPGALGELWNDQMVRGGFVSFMAREKLGKSFMLLDLAVRAVRQKSKVAFFQAGDMTENQQIKRVCSYLARKPIHEKYCGEVFLPVVDCIQNQMDLCDKEIRECDFGPFAGIKDWSEKNIRQKLTRERIRKAYMEEPNYAPCRNCREFRNRAWGVPWVEKKVIKHPVDAAEAKDKWSEFFIKKKRRFRLSTHSNGTLSVQEIEMILDRWERDSGFIPDVIAIDYADLLVTGKVNEFRHQQNQIWMDLRALSQSQNCLLVTATQTDSQSYEQDTLSRKNFSEDKRKYAHVTAMYGLNQDPKEREKKLGIMRINEIVIREGDFDTTSCVTVLQSLNLGRPFLGSYK
jgi:hypothetical protein